MSKGSSIVLSTHAVPFHPGEPDDCLLSFLRRQFWFRHIRQAVVELVETLTTLTGLTRPFRVRLRCGLRLRQNEASPGRITPSCARLTTYVTSNSYGELLSVHENNQACPGAPDGHGKSTDFLGFSVKSA